MNPPWPGLRTALTPARAEELLVQHSRAAWWRYGWLRWRRVCSQCGMTPPCYDRTWAEQILKEAETVGLISQHDLYPDDRDPLWGVQGVSGPGFPTPILCAHADLSGPCGRVIEFADGRWVHRWPLPGADHVAVPPDPH